jgi:hypothetical protein
VSVTAGPIAVGRRRIGHVTRPLEERLGASKSLADWPRTTRLLPWTLAVFMAMVFVIPFNSTELPIPLPLDATLDRPLLMLLFGLWVLSMSTLVGPRRLGFGPVHRAIAIFAMIAVVSLVLNVDTLNRLGDSQVAIKKLALLFSYGFLFVIAASSIRPSEVPRFVKFMLGLAAIEALGLVVEYRLGYNAFYDLSKHVLPGVTPPVDLGQFDSIGRKTIVGPTTHPLAAAMMLSLVLPFAVVGALRTPERRGRVLYGLIAALLLGGAMATQRKTAFVVPSVSILVLTLYRPRLMAKLLPLGLVVVAMIHVAAPGALGGIVQLKPGAFTGVLTTKDRVNDYDAIVPEIVDHPLVGRGYESYDQKRYRILDNQYLTLVVNVGILGVLSYLGIMVTAFVLAHRCSRARDPDKAWFGVAAAVAIVGLTVGSELLDILALPQLPYLFAFVAAFATIMARDLPSARTEWRQALLEGPHIREQKAYGH